MKRRERILEAAIDCIQEFGYGKTNAQLIADRIGISQSAVFYYFPKQQQIFDELLPFIVSSNHETVNTLISSQHSPTYSERIFSYIEGNLLWAFEKPSHAAIVILDILQSAHDERARERINRALTSGEEELYRLFAAAVVEKEIAVNLPVRTIARITHQAIIGATVSIHHLGHQRHWREYYEDIVVLVRSLTEIPES